MFNKRSGKRAGKDVSYCRACATEHTRNWYRNPKNREKVLGQRERYKIKYPNGVRDLELQREYGITLAQYEEMVEAQGDACAICGQEESDRWNTGEFKRLSVDHSHATGKVRGLLCAKCNRGIGMFYDEPELLRQVIIYLENAE